VPDGKATLSTDVAVLPSDNANSATGLSTFMKIFGGAVLYALNSYEPPL